METILVLGATAPTAQAFIHLIKTDYPEYRLKLFVRNPSKLPATDDEVFVGDGGSYEDYYAALSGVTYIYNAIGGVKTGTYTQQLIQAIQDTHTTIKHVVDISAGGIYGEYRSGLRPYLSMVRTMYPQYTKDQIKKVDWYQASGLDFTILRPGLIQDGPETRAITHTPEYREIGKDQFDVNRTTLARVAAEALFNNRYHNQSIAVSNGALI